MKILDVEQGSPAWLAARANYHCASEAPAMMGESRHLKRNELLHMKATGDEKEFSDWVRKNLLEKGHEAERLARAILEDRLGEELFPVTVTDDSDDLLASLDGLTMDETTGFEAKLWNEELAAQVRVGVLTDGHYYWQLEHQIAAGKLQRVIFVCTDGTPERFLQMEYRAHPGRAEQLIAGWKQFDEDVANYQHVETLPKPPGKALMALPALSVQIVGEVKSSNLAVYQSSALEFIRAINTDLQTDQDFADAEAAVKFCGDAEDRLDAVKQNALGQTASIDELFRAMDTIRQELRAKRLTLDKLVTARKATIREEIRLGGVDKFAAHIAGLNERLGKRYMPVVATDFGGVMKGKKTIASLRDAVDTELARAKIEANAIADRIQLNMTMLRELASDHTFLFADTGQIVLKANDDCTALVKLRIAEHKAAEEKRVAEERERIRQEELNRIERERQAAAAAAPAPAPAAVAPAPAAAPPAPVAAVASGPKGPPPKPARATRPTDDQIVDTLAQHYAVPNARVVGWLMTMNLGAVSERLAQPKSKAA